VTRRALFTGLVSAAALIGCSHHPARNAAPGPKRSPTSAPPEVEIADLIKPGAWLRFDEFGADGGTGETQFVVDSIEADGVEVRRRTSVRVSGPPHTGRWTPMWIDESVIEAEVMGRDPSPEEVLLATPVGRFRALRYAYEVDGRQFAWWFSKSIPGLPLRYEVDRGSGPTGITLVEIGQGDPPDLRR